MSDITWKDTYGIVSRSSIDGPEILAAPNIGTVTSKSRPTDGEIIGVLALHYRVHESEVVEWLLDMDLLDQKESSE